MPKATPLHRLKFGSKTSTALLLGLLLSASFTQAAETAYILPTSNGTYADWNFSPYTNVNQGAGCIVGDTNYWSSAPGGNATRESATIVIPASVPANATIDSIDVQVCQAKAVGGDIAPDLATFQTFIRVDSTNTDSGTNITAADPSSNLTPDIQTISVNALRSSITTLEVGVLKTNSFDFQRIYTIAGKITFTLATTSTAVSCSTPINAGDSSTCTATTTPSAGGPPTSDIAFSASDGGSFSVPVCAASGTNQECTADFTPNGSGNPVVTATYPLETEFTGSFGEFTVQVNSGPNPPQPPAATAVPIFGPFGLLLTMLGLGAIGGWQTRRKR